MLEQFPTTILYVDDEHLACKYFVRTAGNEFDVITATSANEALSVLQSEGCRVGVVVTDYRMPGKNGGDLLREIAQNLPHLVCVLVTAFSSKDVLLDSINSAEVFRVLEKPLQAAQVRAVLRLAADLAHDRAARRQRLMAMSDTMSFLAHELTTPLATIINYATGIKRRFASAGGSPSNLQEIEAAVEAMHDSTRYCIDVLTTFAASVRHADKMPKTGSGRSAAQLVASLLNTFPLTPDQRQCIRVDMVEDFQVAGLPNIVSLVLSSILHNALRALEGHARPALRVMVVIDEHPEIRISDNGPGIAPEVLDRLLIDPVSKHARDSGSGWGLMLCNRMMQSFGGGIAIHSAPGSGTRVTLRFPAARTDKPGSGR